MYFLRLFDPWKGKYCSCRPKYSLAPYTGCDHRCLYCYITTYIPQPFNCRVKSNFLNLLPRDLDKADRNIPISIANSSDPYPTLEKKQKITRETLKILLEYNFKVLLVTKSDIFLRDLDILSSGAFALTITINTIDDSIASKLEPGAPLPSRRILAIEKLISKSIPFMVRVDPMMPGLNDDVELLLKTLSEVGVKYITTSTYKARHDSLKRLIKTFPALSSSLKTNYQASGEFVNRSWYLPLKLREEVMRKVSISAKKYNLQINMCREGVSLPRDAPSCDGQHLFDE
jgi:DNA repair photolyase